MVSYKALNTPRKSPISNRCDTIWDIYASERFAIAKSIVESHGGSISVKSSFDGTVFEVILPTAEKAQNEVA